MTTRPDPKPARPPQRPARERDADPAQRALEDRRARLWGAKRPPSPFPRPPVTVSDPQAHRIALLTRPRKMRP